MSAEAKIELSLSPTVASLLARLQDFFAQRNIPVYIVGGLVRDLVMGRPKADIDIAIVADAIRLGPDIAKYLDAKCVILDAQNGVERLLPSKDTLPTEDWQIDLATLQGDLSADLGRRDFTIDAMAINLSELKLTSTNKLKASIADPFNGLKDIKEKLIRMVSSEAFKQDAARLLRAVRLAAELGFSISSHTEELIRRDHQLVTGVAGERLREEFLRLLALPHSDKAILYLDELKLLPSIMPELEATRGLEQPKEHQWDVFRHSLKSIAAVDFLLRRGEWEYADRCVLDRVPWNEALSRHFEAKISPLCTRRVLLKLAALLHDIAKPQTKVLNPQGKIRFFGHAQQGAPVAAAILERLRFSTREIRLVEAVVQHHLRPVQMTQKELPTHKAVYRYFRDVGDAAIDTLYFSLADHLAARGYNLDLTNWQEHANMVAYILAESAAPKVVAPAKLISGHDLQKAFGLKPGAEIGKLLEAVREAQAEGEVTSRESALSYVKKLLALQERKDEKK